MEYAGVTVFVLPGWQWQHLALAHRSLRGSCGLHAVGPVGAVPARGGLGSGGPCLPLEPTVGPVSSVLFHEIAHRKWSSYIPPLLTCPTIITPCLSSGLRFLLSSLSLAIIQPLQSVSTQWTPVLSLGLTSEGWTFSMRLYPHQWVGTAVQRCHSILRVTLHFAFCKRVAVLSFQALKLPLCLGWSPCCWGDLLGCRKLSSSIAPSLECKSSPDASSSFSFCPT